MRKLLVLYPEPADREAFKTHYRDVHLPLCKKLPNALDLWFAVDIEDAPYFAAFEATFADDDALSGALASPEGHAVQADVPNYATGGAIVMVVTSQELDRSAVGGSERSPLRGAASSRDL